MLTPLQSMMLSLYHVSKFQKLSFGSRQLCPKIVLRPQACKAGALELLLSLWGSALLAPTTEHLGSIAGLFEGFCREAYPRGQVWPGVSG